MYAAKPIKVLKYLVKYAFQSIKSNSRAWPTQLSCISYCKTRQNLQYPVRIYRKTHAPRPTANLKCRVRTHPKDWNSWYGQYWKSRIINAEIAKKGGTLLYYITTCHYHITYPRSFLSHVASLVGNTVLVLQRMNK